MLYCFYPKIPGSENASVHEGRDMDIMKKDAEAQKLGLMRIQTVLLAAILIILVIVGIAAATQFRTIKSCIDLIEKDIQAIDTDALNDAVTAFTEAANTIEQNMQTVDMDVLNKAVEAFTDAANQFNKIDMDTFNDTVSALESAAAQLGNVDVDTLNSLVASLEDVAERLQNAVNSVSGFFGR